MKINQEYNLLIPGNYCLNLIKS